MSKPSKEDAFHSLDYASPAIGCPKENKLKERLAVYSVLLLMGAGGVLVLLPGFGRVGCGCGKTQPGATMLQLVSAMVLYANEHQGALPEELDDLERQKYISKPRSMPNFSYIYSGKGINLHSAPRDTILIYEPVSDSAKKGELWIAYADGSVKLSSVSTVAKLIAELKSGHNPPRAEMLN